MKLPIWYSISISTNILEHPNLRGEVCVGNVCREVDGQPDGEGEDVDGEDGDGVAEKVHETLDSDPDIMMMIIIIVILMILIMIMII